MPHRISYRCLNIFIPHFFSGNKDRHSFDTFAEFNFYTFPIMFDNGEGYVKIKTLGPVVML